MNNYPYPYDEDDDVARDRAIDRAQSESFGDVMSLERTDDDFSEEIEQEYDRDERDAEYEEQDAVDREMYGGGYEDDRSYE